MQTVAKAQRYRCKACDDMALNEARTKRSVTGWFPTSGFASLKHLHQLRELVANGFDGKQKLMG